MAESEFGPLAMYKKQKSLSVQIVRGPRIAMMTSKRTKRPGTQAVTNAFALAGYKALAYEYNADPLCENIMNEPGYLYAISLIMRLEPGSIVWCWGLLFKS